MTHSQEQLLLIYLMLRRLEDCKYKFSFTHNSYKYLITSHHLPLYTTFQNSTI